MSINYYSTYLPYFTQNVTAAFKELLSEKHLYQSVSVDTGYIAEEAKKIRAMEVSNISQRIRGGTSRIVPACKHFQSDGHNMYSVLWIPKDQKAPPPTKLEILLKALENQNTLNVYLPTINTFCHHCKGRWPFNPQNADGKWEQGQSNVSDQWFLLTYECQNCKGEPVRYLVRRKKDKLTLCGREPIEHVEVPKVIPKDTSDWYRKSVIAVQSGQVLAGIFLLRVFVEQYWLNIEKVKQAVEGNERPSGDEIGSAYKANLPEDFKKRFPTLCEVYSDLSSAIHTADEEFEIYEKANEQVVKHFDALKLFDLDFS